MSSMWAIVRRDLLLGLRQRGEILQHLFFFLLVIVLFPLGTRPEPAMLLAVGPALIWMAVLLSAMLSLQRLFRPELEDGSLEQCLLSPVPLPLVVLSKVTAHWLASGLIYILASPLIALLLGVPGPAIPVIMAALALGTPTLGLVGAIGVALTLGLPRAGLLLSLLIFPLFVPVLIFGAGAMSAAITGLEFRGPLLMLAAMLVLSVTLAPLATAAALRISLE